MNRVVFIFLSILLIVFPLTIENLENENVNYFELVKNITTELIHTVVKAQVKNPEEINFTNDPPLTGSGNCATGFNTQSDWSPVAC